MQEEEFETINYDMQRRSGHRTVMGCRSVFLGLSKGKRKKLVRNER